MQPFPHPSDATHKIKTDDGPLVYYKLTLWAFSSGELKSGDTDVLDAQGQLTP